MSVRSDDGQWPARTTSVAGSPVDASRSLRLVTGESTLDPSLQPALVRFDAVEAEPLTDAPDLRSLAALAGVLAAAEAVGAAAAVLELATTYAAQRRQFAGPQPGADAEHHHGQRGTAPGRVTPGSRDGSQLRPPGRGVRGRRPGPRERRPPLPRLAVHRHGQPVQGRPVRALSGRPRARQAGHAERLDHVIIQQELRPGRDPRGLSEPAQSPQRRRGCCLPRTCAAHRDTPASYTG